MLVVSQIIFIIYFFFVLWLHRFFPSFSGRTPTLSVMSSSSLSFASAREKTRKSLLSSIEPPLSDSCLHSFSYFLPPYPPLHEIPVRDSNVAPYLYQILRDHAAPKPGSAPIHAIKANGSCSAGSLGRVCLLCLAQWFSPTGESGSIHGPTGTRTAGSPPLSTYAVLLHELNALLDATLMRIEATCHENLMASPLLPSYPSHPHRSVSMEALIAQFFPVLLIIAGRVLTWVPEDLSAEACAAPPFGSLLLHSQRMTASLSAADREREGALSDELSSCASSISDHASSFFSAEVDWRRTEWGTRWEKSILAFLDRLQRLHHVYYLLNTGSPACTLPPALSHFCEANEREWCRSACRTSLCMSLSALIMVLLRDFTTSTTTTTMTTSGIEGAPLARLVQAVESVAEATASAPGEKPLLQTDSEALMPWMRLYLSLFDQESVAERLGGIKRRRESRSLSASSLSSLDGRGECVQDEKMNDHYSHRKQKKASAAHHFYAAAPDVQKVLRACPALHARLLKALHRILYRQLYDILYYRTAGGGPQYLYRLLQQSFHHRSCSEDGLGPWWSIDVSSSEEPRVGTVFLNALQSAAALEAKYSTPPQPPLFIPFGDAVEVLQVLWSGPYDDAAGVSLPGMCARLLLTPAVAATFDRSSSSSHAWNSRIEEAVPEGTGVIRRFEAGLEVVLLVFDQQLPSLLERLWVLLPSSVEKSNHLSTKRCMLQRVDSLLRLASAQLSLAVHELREILEWSSLFTTWRGRSTRFPVSCAVDESSSASDSDANAPRTGGLAESVPENPPLPRGFSPLHASSLGCFPSLQLPNGLVLTLQEASLLRRFSLPPPLHSDRGQSGFIRLSERVKADVRVLESCVSLLYRHQQQQLSAERHRGRSDTAYAGDQGAMDWALLTSVIRELVRLLNQLAEIWALTRSIMETPPVRSPSSPNPRTPDYEAALMALVDATQEVVTFFEHSPLTLTAVSDLALVLYMKDAAVKTADEAWASWVQEIFLGKYFILRLNASTDHSILRRLTTAFTGEEILDQRLGLLNEWLFFLIECKGVWEEKQGGEQEKKEMKKGEQRGVLGFILRLFTEMTIQMVVPSNAVAAAVEQHLHDGRVHAFRSSFFFSPLAPSLSLLYQQIYFHRGRVLRGYFDPHALSQWAAMLAELPIAELHHFINSANFWLDVLLAPEWVEAASEARGDTLSPRQRQCVASPFVSEALIGLAVAVVQQATSTLFPTSPLPTMRSDVGKEAVQHVIALLEITTALLLHEASSVRSSGPLSDRLGWLLGDGGVVDALLEWSCDLLHGTPPEKEEKNDEEARENGSANKNRHRQQQEWSLLRALLRETRAGLLACLLQVGVQGWTEENDMGLLLPEREEGVETRRVLNLLARLTYESSRTPASEGMTAAYPLEQARLLYRTVAVGAFWLSVQPLPLRDETGERDQLEVLLEQWIAAAVGLLSFLSLPLDVESYDHEDNEDEMVPETVRANVPFLCRVLLLCSWCSTFVYRSSPSLSTHPWLAMTYAHSAFGSASVTRAPVQVDHQRRGYITCLKERRRWRRCVKDGTTAAVTMAGCRTAVQHWMGALKRAELALSVCLATEVCAMVDAASINSSRSFSSTLPWASVPAGGRSLWVTELIRWLSGALPWFLASSSPEPRRWMRDLMMLMYGPSALASPQCVAVFSQLHATMEGGEGGLATLENELSSLRHISEASTMEQEVLKACVECSRTSKTLWYEVLRGINRYLLRWPSRWFYSDPLHRTRSHSVSGSEREEEKEEVSFLHTRRLSVLLLLLLRFIMTTNEAFLQASQGVSTVTTGAMMASLTSWTAAMDLLLHCDFPTFLDKMMRASPVSSGTKQMCSSATGDAAADGWDRFGWLLSCVLLHTLIGHQLSGAASTATPPSPLWSWSSSIFLLLQPLPLSPATPPSASVSSLQQLHLLWCLCVEGWAPERRFSSPHGWCWTRAELATDAALSIIEAKVKPSTDAASIARDDDTEKTWELVTYQLRVALAALRLRFRWLGGAISEAAALSEGVQQGLKRQFDRTVALLKLLSRLPAAETAFEVLGTFLMEEVAAPYGVSIMRTEEGHREDEKAGLAWDDESRTDLLRFAALISELYPATGVCETIRLSREEKRRQRRWCWKFLLDFRSEEKNEAFPHRSRSNSFCFERFFLSSATEKMIYQRVFAAVRYDVVGEMERKLDQRQARDVAAMNVREREEEDDLLWCVECCTTAETLLYWSRRRRESPLYGPNDVECVATRFGSRWISLFLLCLTLYRLLSRLESVVAALLPHRRTHRKTPTQEKQRRWYTYVQQTLLIILSRWLTALLQLQREAQRASPKLVQQQQRRAGGLPSVEMLGKAVLAKYKAVASHDCSTRWSTQLERWSAVGEASLEKALGWVAADRNEG